MRGWVNGFTGRYFETEDNCSNSPEIAMEVKPLPSIEAELEIKIQKEMFKILRDQALKSLSIKTPTP